MDYIIDEYIQASGGCNVNALNISLRYNLGVYNFCTHELKPRGYYLSVNPVERGEQDGVKMTGYTTFTGTSMLLLPCKRKTKRMEAEAKQLMREKLESLVAHVCADQKISVTDKGMAEMQALLENLAELAS